MKIDQLAFGTAYKHIWDTCASKAEVVDEVTFSGRYRPHLTVDWRDIKDKVGHLAFSYPNGPGGLELEYLCYQQPVNTFHQGMGADIFFLSHLASHLDSIDLFLAENGTQDVVMDVITTNHTNEKLRELGRKYRYVILDWRQTHGYFYKLIQRIEKRS